MTANRNILVVDDDELVCWGIGKLASSRGLNVMTAGTGFEALAYLKTLHFKTVFLDINLPDSNGLDIMRTIKKMCPDTNVVIITGDDTASNRQEALEGGASYVAKPFDVSQIKDVINRIYSENPAEAEAPAFLARKAQ